MKVRNNGTKMYILGDGTGTEGGSRLLPNRVFDTDTAGVKDGPMDAKRLVRFEKCVSLGIKKGKPFEITKEVAPDSSEKKKIADVKASDAPKASKPPTDKKPQGS